MPYSIQTVAVARKKVSFFSAISDKEEKGDVNMVLE